MNEDNLSMYLNPFYCKACKWFNNPFKIFRGDVCPVCGGEIKRQVGRFKYKTKRRWYMPWKVDTFLIDFVPGRKEKKTNKKIRKMGGM